jgi:hypothetical protein
MIIFYIEKNYLGYAVRNEDGRFIGCLSRSGRDARSRWLYEALNGSKRMLSNNLKKSLTLLNMNVQWKEILTVFREVK